VSACDWPGHWARWRAGALATPDDETVSVHRLLQKVVRDDARARARARARDDYTAAVRAVAALDNAFPAV
jgi:hypothetical protein